ncbi:MAG: flippase activity-associated protein Agl23 [Chthoniobacteraceae bacterium]
MTARLPEPFRTMSAGQRAACLLIVAVAFALRIAALDFKPAHFDEGVNGSFIDGMRTEGCYRYDPANYHGPLHFYVLFAGQQLFGRSLWVLRMPTALIGTAMIGLLLAFARFLPWRTVWIAATAAAISPAMVFFSRYAIHEAWLPFFTLLAVYGGCGIAKGGRRPGDLWALGLGLTGMVLTKETYFIHWLAALIALAFGRFLEWLAPTRPTAARRRPADLFAGSATEFPEDEPPPESRDGCAARPPFTTGDVARVAAVCVTILVLFYSGFFLHWEGLAGLVTTFEAMFSKGTGAEEGHQKEFFYWLKLLAYYEWPAVIGLLAAPCLALRRSPFLAAVVLATGAALAGTGYFALQSLPGEMRPMDFLVPRWNLDLITSLGLWLLAMAFGFFVASPAPDAVLRWICLYGLGSLTAYAIIPYKTPWCIINLLWPLFFALGHLGECLARLVDRRLVYLVGALLAWMPLADMWRLNFRKPTDDGDRYAYVQTTFDINKLLGPVRELVRTSPLHRQMRGIILTEPFPLSWELNDFPNVSYPGASDPIAVYDADFLLVPDDRETEIERYLLGIYFKEHIVLREGGGECWLYLAGERFQPVLPDRAPEFQPRIPQPNPGLPRVELRP